MKICFIDAGIFIDKPDLLNPLKTFGEIEIYEGIPDSVEEMCRRGADAEVIAFGLMQFTNEMLDRLPALKVLQFIGTGVSNFVDVEYAKSKGITVLNIDGYGSNAVAEFAVAMGLALARKVTAADRVLKMRKWSVENLMGMEICGATVGVIGTGSIGRLVAEKYHGLGAKVIACDIVENEALKALGVKYMPIEEVFRSADLVTLHMKVTKENERGIGASLLGMMKQGALLVNVARAELLDKDALAQGLAAGRPAGAAIDVYDREPPSEEECAFAQRDNVIATPHIGYYTKEANDNSIKMAVRSILSAIV